MALDLSYGHSPFPFSDRPVLPHVNAFQDNEKLRVSVRYHHQRSHPQLNEHGLEHDGQIFGHYTLKEIKYVYNFIKSCGSNDGYGISLDEMESAFRKVRRAHKNKDEEAYARRLMNTFEFLLKVKSVSPKVWFKEVDTSQANKGDGKLTWLEFETGMNKLCIDLGATPFNKHDLNAILKYMDPNGDGDLSYHEVSRGFRRIQQPADCEAIIEASGPIMSYLQDFMRDRQIRVRDLFNTFDIRNKKSVPLDVFCDGMSRIASFMSSNPTTARRDQDHAVAPRSAHAVMVRNHEVGESFGSLPPLSQGPGPSTAERKTRSSGDPLSSPMASRSRTQRDYRRHVRRHFREYDDWLKQFDRKLQNGLVLMRKM